jgi:hypothetical protein
MEGERGREEAADLTLESQEEKGEEVGMRREGEEGEEVDGEEVEGKSEEAEEECRENPGRSKGGKEGGSVAHGQTDENKWKIGQKGEETGTIQSRTCITSYNAIICSRETNKKRGPWILGYSREK